MSLLVTPWNPAEVYGILLRNREIAARKKEAESRAISAAVESMLSNQRLAHQFAANLAFKQAHEANANQNYANRLALLSAQQASKNALDDPTPVRLPIESGPPGSLSGAGASSNDQPQLPANVGPNDFTTGSPEQVSPDEPVTTANTPSDASVAAMGASAQLPTLGDQGGATPTSAQLPEFTPQSGITQAIKSLASGNVSGSSFGAVPDGKGGWMKDPQDNGIGASGIRTNDPNARGVALTPSQLLSAGGDGTKADFGRFNVRVSSPAGTTTEPIVDLLGKGGRVDMAPATYTAHGGPTNRGGGLIQNVQYDIVPKTDGEQNPSARLPMQMAQNTALTPDAIARINEAGNSGQKAYEKQRQVELQHASTAANRASTGTGAKQSADDFYKANGLSYDQDRGVFTDTNGVAYGPASRSGNGNWSIKPVPPSANATYKTWDDAVNAAKAANAESPFPGQQAVPWKFKDGIGMKYVTDAQNKLAMEQAKFTAGQINTTITQTDRQLKDVNARMNAITDANSWMRKTTGVQLGSAFRDAKGNPILPATDGTKYFAGFSDQEPRLLSPQEHADFSTLDALRSHAKTLTDQVTPLKEQQSKLLDMATHGLFSRAAGEAHGAIDPSATTPPVPPTSDKRPIFTDKNGKRAYKNPDGSFERIP
jgi:hypothetical protein